MKSSTIFQRSSGVLLHPTSFPGPYGIGDLGKSAYEFIDFLKESKQKLWQIFPIGPTGFGDSPYQCFSSFAGNPLLISPDLLKEDGLLSPDELESIPDFDPHQVDFGPVITYKHSLYKKAFERFKVMENPSDRIVFEKFCEENAEWLENYALFRALKDKHEGAVWNTWRAELAHRNKEALKEWSKRLSAEITYYKFIQYKFFKQWHDIKVYANNSGIQIIGDIPIFVAFDSADVWSAPALYHLDEKGYPTEVAGVPPDYFSETGQLWGNPLYNWATHKDSKYQWWIKRIAHMLDKVDILRIDHFRGFEAYWSVPYGEETAIYGEWKKGPNRDLFKAIEDALGKLPIIAEDLGVITPEVERLRDNFHFPGMKVLQFAFDSKEENDYLPHNYTSNSVVYSGTHDNDTTLGWYQKAPEESKDIVRRYMNTDANDIAWDFIRTAFSSVSMMAVVPLQDILSLGTEARMNVPGVAGGNWQWRYTKEMLHDELKKRLADLTELFGR